MSEPMEIRNYAITIPKDSQYQDKYCQMLVNHRNEGKSLASFGKVIGISWLTIRKWIEAHEDFREASEIADVVALDHWEELAYDQVTGDIKGSSSVLLAMMKNNFPDFYKDKSEVDVTGGVIFKIDTGIPTIEAPEEVDYIEVIDDEELL